MKRYILGGIFFICSLSAMIPAQDSTINTGYLAKLKTRLDREFAELNACIRLRKKCDPARKALYVTAALLIAYVASIATKKTIQYFTRVPEPAKKIEQKSYALKIEKGQEPLWLKKEHESRQQEEQEKQRKQEQVRLKLVEDTIKKAESKYRLRENMAEQYRENKFFSAKMLKVAEDVYEKADIEKNLDKKLNLLQQAIFKMEETIEDVLYEEYFYQKRQVEKRIDHIKDPNYKSSIASSLGVQEYSFSWAKGGGQDFNEKVKNITKVINDMRILARKDY